jgi:hypothetical protein
MQKRQVDKLFDTMGKLAAREALDLIATAAR